MIPLFMKGGVFVKNNIKTAREHAGMTQQDCADCFGVKLRAWQTYEQGISEPKNELLCRIADKFGVTTDYLLGREPKEEPKLDKEKVEAEIQAFINSVDKMPIDQQATMLRFVDDIYAAIEKVKKENKPPSLSQSQTTGAIEDDTAEETADDYFEQAYTIRRNKNAISKRQTLYRRRIFQASPRRKQFGTL